MVSDESVRDPMRVPCNRDPRARADLPMAKGPIFAKDTFMQAV